MQAYLVPRFILLLAMSGATLGQQVTAPQVVRVEGLEEMVGLLQRIDSGIARLASSRWEYKFVQRNRLDENMDTRILALGRDGWELVNVTVEEGFIFKRRVPQ